MLKPDSISQRFARFAAVTGLVLAASTVPADDSANTFFEVTVRPGTSVLCLSDSCTVYFQTPEGTGTHDMLQNGSIKAGVAVGRERVLLGTYSNENLVFRVAGTDLPVACLTVVGSP